MIFRRAPKSTEPPGLPQRLTRLSSELAEGVETEYDDQWIKGTGSHGAKGTSGPVPSTGTPLAPAGIPVFPATYTQAVSIALLDASGQILVITPIASPILLYPGLRVQVDFVIT